MEQGAIPKDYVAMRKHKKHVQLIPLGKFVHGIHPVLYWIVPNQANKHLLYVKLLLRNAQQMELIAYQLRHALLIRQKYHVF